MELLFIGKIPPVEGGESINSLKYILKLAKEGHVVHVVTNANEVELSFRTLFLTDDEQYLSELLGANVIVHNSESIDGFSHIPYSQAYFSKLFGICCDVIKKNNIEHIYGWYFEPYGLLASILAKIFEINTSVFHAGSDLGRLSSHPNLHNAYQWMTENIHVLYTKPSSQNLLTQTFSVKQEIIKTDRGWDLPIYFKKQPLFDFYKYVELSQSFFQKFLNQHKILCNELTRINSKLLNKSLITIGIYGKISSNKGQLELIKALSYLAENNYEFNFIIISCGRLNRAINLYESIIQEQALSKQTWILPFIPNWRIPGFIKSCDIMCFLENNFPIKIHRPQIPLEILSQGRCLVLSNDIVNNLSYKNSLIDKVNYLNVKEVTVEGLIETLQFAMESKNNVRTIGSHGKTVYRNLLHAT
ncbi:glycosyltransferase [Dyadobacter sp. CY356]|uniref:glycosyltransferase n=1 Tax=Dyadobacter sp. CY356 TaxID=2906442 RepID=UPI001F468865|nr:glycosyltransferase [Dyadobacter sp. CY356]MCF0057171.1 glycosyltransferase [Dyadobacter sp. CY356]